MSEEYNPSSIRLLKNKSEEKIESYSYFSTFLSYLWIGNYTPFKRCFGSKQKSDVLIDIENNESSELDISHLSNKEKNQINHLEQASLNFNNSKNLIANDIKRTEKELEGLRIKIAKEPSKKIMQSNGKMKETSLKKINLVSTYITIKKKHQQLIQNQHVTNVFINQADETKNKKFSNTFLKEGLRHMKASKTLDVDSIIRVEEEVRTVLQDLKDNNELIDQHSDITFNKNDIVIDESELDRVMAELDEESIQNQSFNPPNQYRSNIASLAEGSSTTRKSHSNVRALAYYDEV